MTSHITATKAAPGIGTPLPGAITLAVRRQQRLVQASRRLGISPATLAEVLVELGLDRLEAGDADLERAVPTSRDA
jgi:hypothetical protein